MTDPGDAPKSPVGLILVIVAVAIAAALVALPIFDCDACPDVRKAFKAKPSDNLRCPCCGTSVRLSLIHRWMPEHKTHKGSTWQKMMDEVMFEMPPEK